MDPYVGITDDFQVYVKHQYAEKNYGTASDNEEASTTLLQLRDKAYESDRVVFSTLVESLSAVTQVFSL